MALDPSIILAGQAPNIIGAIDAGNIAGQRRNEFVRTNALNAFLQQNGPGVMAGDQNALAGLARFDPTAALGVQDQRQQMAARDQAMTMARQQARDQAQAQAAQMTAEQRAQEAAMLERVLAGASSFYAQGDQAGYTSWLQQNNLDPAQYPFEQFPAIAATAGDVLDTLKTFQDMNAPGDQFSADRYRNVEGVGLVDLAAPGGPVPVDLGGGQPVTVDPTELRKEWNALPAVRQFAQQADTFGRVAAAAQDPSPVGDLALIYNFMKSLDPGSTVMAGEYANAQNTGSLDQTIMAQYNAVVNGERLTDEQRADFLNRSARMYQAAEQQYGRIRSQYEADAIRAGIDPAQLTDFRYRPQGQVPFSTVRPQQRPAQPVAQATQAATQPAVQAAPVSPVLAPTVQAAPQTMPTANTAPSPVSQGPDLPPPAPLMQSQTFVKLAADRGMTPQELWANLPIDQKQALAQSWGQ
jgi:hypothetical protein